MFDVVSFFKDNRVAFISQGHKHCQRGWVQTACPFCTGNPGWHLGFCIQGNFFNCWRCGWKNHEQVIQHYTHCSWMEARQLRSTYNDFVPVPKLKHTLGAESCKTPSDLQGILPHHRTYLAKRCFDISELEKIWKIQSVGPTGPYQHRIYIPIFFEGRLASYQGRQAFDGGDMKYKACSMENEYIHHKNIVYGADEVPGEAAIIVEGVTDVWKIGPGAVATFGIKWKIKQLKTIADRFAEVYIVFDPEKQAQEQARKMMTELRFRGVRAEVIQGLATDPGDMSITEARSLRKRLIGV